MANGQVKNFKEASKYLPLVEFQEMQGSEILRPATRGMQGSNMQNARMDGMGIVVTGANSMESLQQIEVLNGLGGALYGPANPSGMFNFVPKRPTDSRSVRRRVELRRPIDGDRARRRRRTGRAATGSSAIAPTRCSATARRSSTGSDLKRGLVSLAADARPFAHTTIEGLFSYYNLGSADFPAGSPTGGRTRETRSSSCRRTRPIRRARDTGNRPLAWISRPGSASFASSMTSTPTGT